MIKLHTTFFVGIALFVSAMLNMAYAADVPDDGFYRIKGVANDRYVEVVGQFMSAPNVTAAQKYTKAGTVMYLDAESDGKVNLLRSQGVPYPNYFDMILVAAQEWLLDEIAYTGDYAMKRANLYLERTADNEESYYAKAVIPAIDDLVQLAADNGKDITAEELWNKGIEKAAQNMDGLGIPISFIATYLQGLAQPGGTFYLTDDGGSFGGVESADLEAKGDLAKWVLEPVDNADNSFFGVNATVVCNGKNYATLYTDFPYQLPEGMKAYTISNAVAGIATLVPIEGNIVPWQTPVVLECAQQEATYNRMLPIGEMTDGGNGEYAFAEYPQIQPNKLTGVFFNENAEVYALSVKDGELAFSDARTVMVGNRAYSLLEAVQKELNLPIGYYRIQGVKNKKYTEVLMQFLSAPIIANNSKYTRAGTVMYLNANADGLVNMLRSQAIPYPNYFNPVLQAGQQWLLDQLGDVDYEIQEMDLVIVPAGEANGKKAYYATVTLPSLEELCALAAEKGIEITPKEIWEKGVDLAKGTIAEQFGIADMFVQAYLYPLNPSCTYFLTDDGGSFGTVEESGLEAKGDLARWYIEPVDEENYFGVNCLTGTSDGKYGDVKQDDYWYTTAYFDFPYYLSDNNGTINTAAGVVNAYIITGFNEHNDAICEPIGKYVPAQTPVLLECTSEEAAINKLFPTLDENDVDVSANILQGNDYLVPCDYSINNKYFFNIEWKDEWANKVRTLDVKKWNEEDGWLLGFYAFNYTNFLNGNKAFIYLDDTAFMSDYITEHKDDMSAPAGVKGNIFRIKNSTTGEDLVSEDGGFTDGINSIMKSVENEKVYDMQGRKVSRPFSGIFIINGKKVVLK